MAKKKATPRAAKKRTPAKKKSSAKKPTSKKPTAPANSVDAVLEKYEKERKSKEGLLVRSRKQIEELGNKVTSIQEQIVKLTETVATTETELGEIDSRRAADVADVLAKLGVKLSDIPAAATEPESPQQELEFGSGINDEQDSID